jgi:hypothetical protein
MADNGLISFFRESGWLHKPKLTAVYNSYRSLYHLDRKATRCFGSKVYSTIYAMPCG